MYTAHCAVCILSKGSTLHTKGKLKRIGIQYAHKEKQPGQTESFLKTLLKTFAWLVQSSRLGSKTKKLRFTFDVFFQQTPSSSTSLALYRVVAWI